MSTKLYDLLESIMQEVGENTAEPYETTRTGVFLTEAKYSWKTDEGVEYVLYIVKNADFTGRGDDRDLYYSVEFGIWTNNIYVDYGATSKTTQTGNLRRVMATVIDCIKKEIALDNAKSGITVRQISIEPTKEDETDERRAKLYLSYVEKNKPEGSTVSYEDDKIKITLPDKK